MTMHSRRWAFLATGGLLVIGLTAGCGQVSLPFVQSAPDAVNTGVAQPAQPAPAAPIAVRSTGNAAATPTKPGTASSRPVPVALGSLTETLSLDGVIAAKDQVPLTYPQRGMVDDVAVKAGQIVKQKDVLITLNAGDLSQRIDAARLRLETSKANLAQGQAKLQSAPQRMAAAQAQQQLAIADLESALRQAQDTLKVVQAGKPAVDRIGGETAVSNGKATLQVYLNDLDKALAGPDEATIRAAQREVDAAQVTLSKAQADLVTLLKGATPEVLRPAETAVQKAQIQLQLARGAPIDPKVDPTLGKLQHDVAVNDAQLSLEGAQAALAKLKSPPPDADVKAANQRVQYAQEAVDAAQAKVDTLQAGPDQTQVDIARSKVEYARHYLAEAQQNNDEVLSHPTPRELKTAQDDVRKAQANLDAALQAPPPVDDLPDMAALQAAVDQDQSAVNFLAQSLEDTRLTAPFDGLVVAVRVKPGDAISSAKPFVVLARSGPPTVRLDLADAEAARMATGQQATVQLVNVGTTAAPINAVVETLTPPAPDGSTGASATVRVDWPNGQAPKLGTPVTVTVSLGQKQGVLIVPKTAIHQSGGKSRVEVQDGNLRRVVSVQVGITTADSAEIVSGLTEGQIVLAGPA